MGQSCSVYHQLVHFERISRVWMAGFSKVGSFCGRYLDYFS